MSISWSSPSPVLQASRARVSKAVCSAASGTEAFAPKGPYAAGTAYVVGDVVTAGGIPYICIQNGTGQAPATSPATWRPLVALGKPNFNPRSAYAVGDVVRSGGLWVCLSAVAAPAAGAADNAAPSEGATWSALSHNGVAGLDLQGLQAVVPVVELAAGAVIGANASLRILFINPATGQVNETDPADFPASLKQNYTGQHLPGWKVDGAMGWMLAVPFQLGAASSIYLVGSPRASILGA